MSSYKKLEEMELGGLARRIIGRHPLGFVGGIIYGERGYGKSMYALKTMALVYFHMAKNQGDPITEYQAYEKALECMIFLPYDFIKIIEKNIDDDIVTPVLCLDDATVHFNSYMFFYDIYQVIQLKGLFDTIRTSLTSLLMTCPTPKLLLKFLREYDDFKIQIRKYNAGWERYARAYTIRYLPDQHKKFVSVPFQDHYSCYVPNPHYDNYMKKRKYYLKLINERIKKVLKEHDNPHKRASGGERRKKALTNLGEKINPMV